MRMYDLITKKKHGEELTDAEIAFWIKGFTTGEIPDYQVSALLMAICLKGLNERETATLTMEMARSGDMLDLSAFHRRRRRQDDACCGACCGVSGRSRCEDVRAGLRAHRRNHR